MFFIFKPQSDNIFLTCMAKALIPMEMGPFSNNHTAISEKKKKKISNCEHSSPRYTPHLSNLFP
jgi:hypothetical protein